MTQRVKFTVTSHSADDSGAEDGEAGDATRADGATPELSVAESNEDEPSSNVVDLTDYSQIAEPSDKAVTVAVDAKVKTNETKISNSNPSEALVVKEPRRKRLRQKPQPSVLPISTCPSILGSLLPNINFRPSTSLRNTTPSLSSTWRRSRPTTIIS